MAVDWALVAKRQQQFADLASIRLAGDLWRQSDPDGRLVVRWAVRNPFYSVREPWRLVVMIEGWEECGRETGEMATLTQVLGRRAFERMARPDATKAWVYQTLKTRLYRTALCLRMKAEALWPTWAYRHTTEMVDEEENRLSLRRHGIGR